LIIIEGRYDDEEEAMAAAAEEQETMEATIKNFKKTGKAFGFGALSIALCSPIFYYETLFFVAALLAVVQHEPLFTTYGLLELCFWKGSQTVIDAVRFNAYKMLQTVILGLLCMYVWMVFGMAFLWDAHVPNECTTMFQCFMSYLFKAVRDNGVKEMLDVPGEDFVFPRNFVDAFLAPEGVSGGGISFIARIIWDMSFQILFLYILLSIITGIVIDGFSGLKEEREASENDLKSVCFVCSLTRFKIDMDGIGFDLHVKEEHNPKWYLFFLLRLKRRRVAALTGQEKYVKDKMWPPGDGPCTYDWLPRDMAVSMLFEQQTEEDESSNLQLERKVQDLEAALLASDRNTAAAFARIEQTQTDIKHTQNLIQTYLLELRGSGESSA